MLAKNGVKVGREEWLAEAELAEKSQNYQTCFALVRAAAEQGVAEEDRERIWAEDADICEKRGSLFTARAIFQYAVERLPEKAAMLQCWLDFEERNSAKRVPPQDAPPSAQPDSPEQLGQHHYYDEALECAL